MTPDLVRTTRSGLIIRREPALGLLTYSPYNGLIFACYENDARQVVSWLDGKSNRPPSDEYLMALGPGWIMPLHKAQYPIRNLLPSSNEYWPIVPMADRPIIINWLITGNCPLACGYCYAEELMRQEEKEPDEKKIKRIVENLLSYKPLVVVITGGEPLLSPYLPLAINLLYGHVGLMVDTSGYLLKESQIDMFKKFGVGVRVSLDSERPKINEKPRSLSRRREAGGAHNKRTTASGAMRTICRCLEAGIPVTVQSVATKQTTNDLLPLGDKLFRLGISYWRIFQVQPSEKNLNGYKALVGSARKQDRMYYHIFKTLIRHHNNRWKRAMALQIIHSWSPNAVILISPEGVYYTESNVRLGKVILDERQPFKPRLREIHYKTNMQAHAERYLNLTSARILVS